MNRARVNTVDTQYRDETGSEKIIAKHRLLIISMLVGAISGLLFYGQETIPEVDGWWLAVALVALVLFVLSWVVDPVLAVWTRWEVVAIDAGLRGSRSGVPARWLVYPVGFNSVKLVVSSDGLIAEDWDTAGEALAQNFGYSRVVIDHSKHRVKLTFTNAPSSIEKDVFKELNLNDQAILMGIDKSGKAYSLDTAGHSGMMIAGAPGSGKTVAVRRLAQTFAQNPANEVVLFDGKGTNDFGDLSADNVEVFSGTPEDSPVIVQRLEALQEELKRRAATGDVPGRVVVVIDEAQGYMTARGLTGEEKKTREKTERLILDLIRRGRSLGFLTILATQKPDSDTIPTSVRDSCFVKMSGRLRTVEAEKMAMGEAYGKAQHLSVGQMLIDDGRGAVEAVKIAQVP